MPVNQPILFCVVTWMEYYDATPGDKASGGGSFIDRQGYGHEVFNFRPFNGWYYGFVQLRGGIALERLGSHSDLGTNWSITLEVREQHRLITQGVYRRIRHPMYLALVLYSIGEALVIPNWVAGPANLIAFAILLALRVRAEERMMGEEFGDEYAVYSARTKRLIPGVW